MAHSFSRRLEQAFELPSGAISGDVHIELFSNARVVIDGCKGISEYTDDLIRLQTAGGAVRLCGRGLELCSLAGDAVIVCGTIASVEFV